MSKLVEFQVLRATTANRTSYTPKAGEFIYVISGGDAGNLYIGDGTTAGGNLIVAAGGTGETNNASNVGVGGVRISQYKCRFQ